MFCQSEILIAPACAGVVAMWLLPATSYQTANAMITIRSIAAIPRGKTVWDEGKGAVAGFGARRQTGEAVAYVLKYRTAAGRQRWHTIGRHGAPWTPDLARTEARRVLGEVTKGCDPAEEKQQGRRAKTLAELCDDYLEASEAGRVLTRRKLRKKASTLATDRGRIERHIKPLLGNLKVAAVSRTDIERFNNQVSEGATAARVKTGKHGLARVTGGRGTATRTLALLGVIFSYAVRQGLRADNPAHGIEKHAYNERQRRATNDEYAALGKALRSMPEPTWPIAVAMARFLALSGWRRGEALALTWPEVDLATRTARLKDTKTGASLRPLSHAACEVLRALPRLGELVFPASIGVDKLMRGFHKAWLRVAKRAKLPPEVTPHTLRHSFASVAADLGFSELTIAALLGHKKASVTAKYAHHADAVLLQAADAVAERISKLMGDGQHSGAIIPFKKSPA
jgi:integrase